MMQKFRDEIFRDFNTTKVLFKLVGSYLVGLRRNGISILQKYSSNEKEK